MPIAAPIVAALITAGVSGTEIGLQASGAFSPSSSGPSQQQIQQQQQEAAQKQQQLQQQQAAHAASSNAQEQTGGSLGDSQMSALIASLIGTPGDIGSVQNTVFGPNSQSSGSPDLTKIASGLSSTEVG